MEKLNFTKLFVTFIVAKRREMSMLKYAVLMIFVLNSLPSLAQYRDGLPPIETPMSSKYDYKQARNGQIFSINYDISTPANKSIWSLLFYQKERFRFCANGTLAMLGLANSYATLNFYNTDGMYLGSVDSENENINVLSKKNVTFSPGFPKRNCLTLTPNEMIAANPMTLNLSGNKVILKLSTNDTSDSGWIGTKSNNGLHLGTNGISYFFIDNGQNVYLGMSKQEANNVKQALRDKYRLFVAKGILTEDVAMGPKSTWADFVFNKDYNLRKLDEVEEFISENNHLPDVPSAEQVAEEGYSQHDINKVLLQKIEELTLYTIKQEKRIAVLEAELNNLNK